MVFNSIAYILFLGISALAYYLFPGKYRWIWLLIASVGYYLSFIPIFLALLVGVVILNFFMAGGLAKASDEKTRTAFILIISANVIILAFFKYFNFLFPGNNISLYNELFFQADPINRMILPLGLSYLMFTVISYQIEIKRKTILPEKHFGYFSLYLLFFPKIAQGPIERPQHLIPQLRQYHPFDYDMVVEGLKLMLWGYFKKLVVADRLAIYVNSVYNNSEHHNGTTLLVATVFFAFQLYADFSGYTDIALGSAKIFGFNLTNNFKRPYLATSIKDFWNRWHITFSQWLRDYIFLPLAFSLSSRMKKQSYFFVATEKWIYLIAIMVTFIICGLWHGEGWNYLAWGALFGVYLTWSNWTEKLWKNMRKRLHIRKTAPVYIFYKILLTFSLVTFAWIFFRANSIQNALYIVKTILSVKGKLFIGEWTQFAYGFAGIVFLAIIEYKREFKNQANLPFVKKHWMLEQLSYVMLIILILLVGVFDGSQFIYFQF